MVALQRGSGMSLSRDVLVHENEVGIRMDSGTDSQLVFAIGDRFVQALKTGAYDDLFLP